MKKNKVQSLKHGIYEVYWKQKVGGGMSVASIGSLANGERWIAPANWTNESTFGIASSGKVWRKIKSVTLLKQAGVE